jgi:NitT/TauT family transport system permease protein
LSLEAVDPVPANQTPAPVVTFTAPKPNWRNVFRGLSPLLVAIFAFLLHLLPDAQSLTDPDHYSDVLLIILALSLLLPITQYFSKRLQPLIRHNAPLIAAAIFALALWDLITLKLNWLPVAYVPPPYKVIWVFVTDWRELANHLLYSFANLIAGYFVGTVIGLVCGVLIGWSPRVRYWGMPLLKLVGPIPATAWIPLAMIFAPSAFQARVGLIALAVWFPVTMLTASGISNVRLSYFDVARTMGAKRGYLIFRVAIPAALPSIFLGLFMGLGASFLTLIAAESVGSRQGLGFYISNARESFVYAKIYAALILMAVFFSLLMTALFKIRDHVLVWQKGVMKW